MSTYNGHKNWNHWNVSLWISNDEGLYRLALECVGYARKCHQAEHCGATGVARIAARRFIAQLGADRTPDGAPYTLTSISAALKGLQS